MRNTDEFSGEPAEFEVVDGIMRCRWPGKRPDLCIPLRVFRVNLQRAAAAVREYDARTADVVQFRSEFPGDHAA